MSLLGGINHFKNLLMGLRSGQVIGRSDQLSLNNFFDPSTPSMRKGCELRRRKKTGGKTGEKTGEKKKENKVATNVVASRPPNGDQLQRRPLVPIFENSISYLFSLKLLKHLIKYFINVPQITSIYLCKSEVEITKLSSSWQVYLR